MSSLVPLGLAIATALASFAISLMASLRALDILAGRVTALRGVRSAATGALVGAAAWAEFVNAAGLQAFTRIDLGGAAAALVIAMAGAGLAFAAFRRCDGLLLRIVVGGALLGLAVAICQFVLLCSLGADVEVDETHFANGVTVSSALGVAAFAIFARQPRVRGRVVAAALIAAGLTGSTALGAGSLQVFAPLPPDVLVAAHLAPLATQLVAVLLAAAYVAERAPAVRLATRARAWRGSSRPFPRRIQAGTALLRPRSARSAAAPAAALARRDRPAR